MRRSGCSDTLLQTSKESAGPFPPHTLPSEVTRASSSFVFLVFPGAGQLPRVVSFSADRWTSAFFAQFHQLLTFRIALCLLLSRSLCPSDFFSPCKYTCHHFSGFGKEWKESHVLSLPCFTGSLSDLFFFPSRIPVPYPSNLVQQISTHHW